MKCPVCGDRTQVDLDLHSEGFSSEEFPVKECGACGSVWRVKRVGDQLQVDLVKKGTPR